MKNKVGRPEKDDAKVPYGTRYHPKTIALLKTMPGKASQYSEDAIWEKRMRDTKIKYYGAGDPNPMSYP